MKKFLLIAAIAALGAVGAAQAAPSNTCPSYPGEPCAGGPTRGWNYTTNQFEMVPQCFPWVFRTDFLNGNLVSLYENQRICRENRARDFHW